MFHMKEEYPNRRITAASVFPDLDKAGILTDDADEVAEVELPLPLLLLDVVGVGVDDETTPVADEAASEVVVSESSRSAASK